MSKNNLPELNLKKLKIILPKPPVPAGAYVSYTISKKIIYVAGQLPWVEGKLKYTGKLGKELTLEQGYECAKICCINSISVLKSAVKLKKIKQILKVVGTVSCSEDFYEQPKVVNGCSELLLQVFGEKGRHSRAVSGTNALPLNAPLMIEIIAEIE